MPNTTVPTSPVLAASHEGEPESGASLQLPGFSFGESGLTIEGIPIATITREVGTPTYIYSAEAIRRAYRRLLDAFTPLQPRLHYAVKANGNLRICHLLRQLGAGMDVVSGGELERAWMVDCPMDEIVFAGVGKTRAEIRAALDGRYSPSAHLDEEWEPATTDRGPVGLFNIESESELRRIAEIAAELGVAARACLRVNPDVDARTHEYTTTGRVENKFGIDAEHIPRLFDEWATHPRLELVGLHVHIGSPVREVAPFTDAARVLLRLLDTLEARGHRPEVLNLGGGWAVDYHQGEAPTPEDYAASLVPLLRERVAKGLRVLLEPGRSLVANAGVLITEVQHVKEGRSKRFVICDAGMHTLIRPALYRAFHFVWPVEPPPEQRVVERREDPGMPGLRLADVVGPICESGDFLARDRPLPEIQQGDLLAIFSAGAYGMSMASNYNEHGYPAEVLVDGDRVEVVRERQPLASALRAEMREPRRLRTAASRRREGGSP